MQTPSSSYASIISTLQPKFAIVKALLSEYEDKKANHHIAELPSLVERIVDAWNSIKAVFPAAQQMPQEPSGQYVAGGFQTVPAEVLQQILKVDQNLRQFAAPVPKPGSHAATKEKAEVMEKSADLASKPEATDAKGISENINELMSSLMRMGPR